MQINMKAYIVHFSATIMLTIEIYVYKLQFQGLNEMKTTKAIEGL